MSQHDPHVEERTPVTRTHPRRRPVRLLAAGLALLAGLSVSGCGPVRAGAAAVVGDQRITVAQLHDGVAAVQDEQQKQGGGAASGTAKLQQDVLTRKIVGLVLAEAGRREHVHVTQGEIDDRVTQVAQGVGGRKRLEAALLQQGVATSELPGLVRQSLLAEKIGEALVPGSGQQVQAQRRSRTNALIVKVSKDLGVTVSPRYGTWNVDKAQLGAARNDLSRPAKSGSGG